MTQKPDLPIELEEFIQDHEKLLTVIGVFGGLTALLTQIQPKGIGDLMVFWVFLIFLVLNFELLSKFPKLEEFDSKLTLFQFLLMAFNFVIVLYLVFVYYAFTVIFGSLIALMFGSAIITWVFKYSEKHKTRGKILQYGIAGLVMIGFLFLMVAVLGIILLIIGLIIG